MKRIILICLFTIVIAASVSLIQKQNENQTIEDTKVESNEVVENTETEIENDKIIEETEEAVESEKETESTVVEDNVIDDAIKETVENEVNHKSEPTFYLSDYERKITECIVMGESGAESYEGQVLVAQCILNGCIKENVQPSKLRSLYQYFGWKENPTDSVKKAVSAVFDDGYKVTDEFILYFYAPYGSKGGWHETQRFVIEEGGHRFFAGWDK